MTSFLVIFLFSSHSHLSANSDRLFEKAFGVSKVSQELQYLVKLNIDQTQYEEILLYVVGSESYVEGGTVFSHLKDRLQNEAYEKIQAIEEEGRLSFSKLRELGFIVTYDESSFLLKIQVPGTLYALQEHSIEKRNQKRSGAKEKSPDPFSGVINFSVVQPYRDNFSEKGLDPFEGNFESFVNLYDFVFEGDLSYTDRNRHPWKISRKLVSYDLSSELLRFSFGDLQAELRGFQSSNNFGGVGISRSYRLNPSLRITPSGRQEIYLETPSTVEVFVNGQRREKIRLSSGTHLLSRIPGYSGSNAVEVRITDSFNRVRSLKSNFLYDSSLLKYEAYRYSFNIGFKSRSTNNSVEYLSEEPIWSAFYEKGVRDNITLKGYLEGDKHLYLYGFRALRSYRLGKVVLDAALSHINGSDTDSAFSVGFSSYNGQFSLKNMPANWNVSMSKRGRRFTGVSDLNPNNEGEWSALFSANLVSSKQSTFSLSANIDYIRDNKVSPFQLSIGHNYNFKNGLDLNLGCSFERQSNGIYDRRALVQANWAFGGDGTRVSTSYDTEKSRKELNLKKSWRKGKQHLDLEVTPVHSLEERGISTNLNLQSERFTSSLSYQFQNSEENESDPESHSALLSFSSAIVFSGTKLGFSRPVSGSFLIVDKSSSFRSNGVYVNPIGDDYLAKSLGILPAVVSDVRDYEHKEILLDVEDMPIGYSISHNHWLLKPRHKSGFSIYLDSSSRVLLEAYLVDESGVAVSLKAGKIHPISSDEESISFFTNRKGKFRILGLREGKYKIEIFSKKYDDALLIVPKGKIGLYRKGNIILNSRK